MAGSSILLGYIRSVVYGQRRGAVASVVLAVLRGLSAVYRLGLRLYLLPFDAGLRPRKRLPCPVLSIGNLTTGGTGKTPMTQYVCEGLLRRGWKPAVLSYGYGGSLAGQFGVVSDTERTLLSPQDAGDESAMLARRLPGMPVVVGKDRHRSGKYALERLDANIAVLDDGFQVWKLCRDLDIVLVDGNNPFDNGRMLPAGQLREPVPALRRAHCVVLMGTRSEEQVHEELGARIRAVAPGANIFCARYVPHTLSAVGEWPEVNLEGIQGQKVFALSSIANPESFERTLAEAGAVIVGREHFPDHWLYTPSDVLRVGEMACALQARFVVTTEKDAVKLMDAPARLPILALGVKLFLNEEAKFWKVVDDALTAYGAGPSYGANT